MLNFKGMKRTLFILLATLCYASANAFSLTGRIVDEHGVVVPYANIYVKENPQTGTITDLQGVFTIDEIKNGQSLVVSFIGYRTMDVKIKKEPKDTIKIKLVEQPILLQEAQVGNNKKQSHRRQMKDVIADVRNQMNHDFPNNSYTHYNVVSDYAVYNDSMAIALESLGGDIVEMPGKAKDGKDLIQLKINWITRYRDAHTQENYLRLDSTLKKDMNSKLVRYADSSRFVHKFLWGSGIKQGFEQFADHPSRWELEERDSVTVFTYTETRNYLGIVKGKLVLTYYLDPISYSVRRVSQDLTTDINIPFGYKLTKEQIQMLNTLVIGGVQFEKYWVKRAHVDIQRNIIYQNTSDGGIAVKEKNVVTNIHIEDRKRKKPVDFKQTGSIKVNSVEFNATPYSKAVEMGRYPLILKPKP